MHPVIVISDRDVHSASELCNSRMSAGPDFVSTKEGLYCDMCTGELWPVCSSAITQGCFDVSTKTMRSGNGTTTDSGTQHQPRDEITGRAIPEKEHREVLHWK